MKVHRQSQCASCGAVTPDGLELCQDHAAELLAVLRRLPGLLEDLDVTLSRQDAMGGEGDRRATETPLVFREDASTALAALRAVLVRWTRAAAPLVGITALPAVPVTIDPHDPARTRPAVTVALLAARALAEHIDGLRTMVGVGALARELADAVKAAERAVDRRVARVCVGECGADVDDQVCDVYLYAQADDVEITCPRCGSVWSISERREWLLACALDHAGTAAEVAGLLRATGVEVSTQRLQQWAQRGKLAAVGVNGRGWPLYRVRDAYAVHARMEAKRRCSAA